MYWKSDVLFLSLKYLPSLPISKPTFAILLSEQSQLDGLLCQVVNTMDNLFTKVLLCTLFNNVSSLELNLSK